MKETTMSKGKFPRPLEAYDSPKMRMPAFSTLALFGTAIAAPARDNIKDLGNDILSCGVNVQNCERKSKAEAFSHWSLVIGL
jgi:hypothetical protein